MPQYEVSNFGTKPCRHNQAYWRYEPYLGAGCGAVGFDGKKRYSANKNIALYLENPNSLDFEKITSDEHFFEQLFLGLRSNIGISEDIMSPLVKKRAQTLVNENLLKFKNGNYYSKDYFLADSLVLFIVQ
ncbi:MAG: hypothetical protein GX780_01110 [Campylobacteraceae bacterium]|nr:hypothetical protein [Campylobacteraceae bacterium]